MIIEDADAFSAQWRLVFFYIGYAVEMHERWLRGPWLTRALCACHPLLYVGAIEGSGEK